MNALIKVFEGEELTFRSVEGRWAMTAEQVGVALGASNPRQYTHNLITRYRDEVEPFLSVLNLSTEAGPRSATLILDQGIYTLAMLARTKRAALFRRWIGDLLIELQQGTKQVVSTDLLESLVAEVKSLREDRAVQQAQHQEKDNKQLMAEAMIQRLEYLAPKAQEIIARSLYGIPGEPERVWTATQLSDELNAMGLEATKNMVGIVSNRFGVKPENENVQNEYGFWHTTPTHNFLKVVPQFMYNELGRKEIIRLFREGHGQRKSKKKNALTISSPRPIKALPAPSVSTVDLLPLTVPTSKHHERTN